MFLLKKIGPRCAPPLYDQVIDSCGGRIDVPFNFEWLWNPYPNPNSNEEWCSVGRLGETLGRNTLASFYKRSHNSLVSLYVTKPLLRAGSNERNKSRSMTKNHFS